MRPKDYDHLFKFVMVGNSSVGKSSLLLRFADEQFNQNYTATIGVDFRFKMLEADRRRVKLQIWDTAGQQRFRTIVNTYYKNSQAVLIVFDLGMEESFNDIKSYWVNEVTTYTDPSVILVLVGNKSDGDRRVTAESINSYVADNKMIYFETSARTGAGIKELFQQVTEQALANIVEKGPLRSTEHLLKPSAPLQEERKKSCYGCPT